MRAWKLDLLIALAALVVSGLTASAALYQSKVFSDQLSATVWPYLSFTATAAPSSYELTLENDGAGPAIIVGAQLLVDGKPQPSIVRALPMLAHKVAAHSGFSYVAGSVGPGQVIRPGANATVLKISAPNIRARLAAAYARVRMDVYYCSLLNRCWVVRLHSTDRPQEVTGQSYPHSTIQSE
jgi:hypothetical protein